MSTLSSLLQGKLPPSSLGSSLEMLLRRECTHRGTAPATAHETPSSPKHPSLRPGELASQVLSLVVPLNHVHGRSSTETPTIHFFLWL